MLLSFNHNGLTAAVGGKAHTPAELGTGTSCAAGYAHAPAELGIGASCAADTHAPFKLAFNAAGTHRPRSGDVGAIITRDGAAQPPATATATFTTKHGNSCNNDVS